MSYRTEERQTQRFPLLQRRRMELVTGTGKAGAVGELAALNRIIWYGVEDHMAEDAAEYGWPS